MIAGLSQLIMMVGGVVGVEEAEFCVTDFGSGEMAAGLG
jgi:hypothetical protein